MSSVRGMKRGARGPQLAGGFLQAIQTRLQVWSGDRDSSLGEVIHHLDDAVEALAVVFPADQLLAGVLPMGQQRRGCVEAVVLQLARGRHLIRREGFAEVAAVAEADEGVAIPCLRAPGCDPLLDRGAKLAPGDVPMLSGDIEN
jgi:hypothetical protein